MDKKFIYTTSQAMADELRKKGFIQVSQNTEGWTFINESKKSANFVKNENLIFTNKLYC